MKLLEFFSLLKNKGLINQNKAKKLLKDSSVLFNNNEKLIKEFDIQKIYIDYIDNKKVSDYKLYILFEYIISNLDENNLNTNMADKIYSKILNSKDFLSYYEMLFVLKYTIYLKYMDYKYDKDFNVKLGYEDFCLPSVYLKEKKDKENTSLAACRNGKLEFYFDLTAPIMGIPNDYENPSRLRFKNILNFIKVINHEMVHYMQLYEQRNGFCSDSAFYKLKSSIFRKEYKRENFNEYEENYNFKEIEIEAEIEAYRFAIELARKYAPDAQKEISKNVSEKKEIILEQAISHQFTFNKKLFLTDEYNIKALIAILRKKPIWCEMFPILQIFFDKEGKLKSEKELLKGYCRFGKNYKEKSKSIYNEFFTYIYGISDKYLENDLPPSYNKLKIQIICDLIKRECDLIEELEKLLNVKESELMLTDKKFVEDNLLNILNAREQRIILYCKHLYKIKQSEQDISNSDLNSFIELINDLLKLIDEQKKKINGKLSKDNVTFNKVDERSNVDSVSRRK